eukprot:gene16723-22990_t
MFHHASEEEGVQVMDMRSIVEIAFDVANAISYLHARGLLHGDLKSDNVLLQTSLTDARGWIAKVADFGTSRLLANNDEEELLLVSRFGTATHMPPETIRDNVVVLASDVYSFGILMWELYCIDKPFAEYSNLQLLNAIVALGERPKFPSHCPTGYAQLANECMMAEFQFRPSLKSVAARLRAMLNEGLKEAENPYSGQIVVPMFKA